MSTIKPLALSLAVALAIPAAVAAAPNVAATAPGSAAADIARDHLAQELGIEDVASSIVTDEYTSAHNGVTHVYLRQSLAGLEVLGADATVNIKDGAVLHDDHRLLDGLAELASGVRVLGEAQAVAAGAIAVGADPRTLDGAPGLAYQVTDDGRVRLAWSFQLREAHDWWNLSVDAETGEVLYTSNWVDHEDISEIAARTARPEAEGAARALLEVDPILPRETVADGSSYRVFPMPLENPLDNGAEHLVVDEPASASASPLGWHDLDGEDGADTTITQGNNVDAYADTVQASFFVGLNLPDAVPEHNKADGGETLQPNGGEGLDFDFSILSYDATPFSYRDAAITNLFYWNNVMHDVTHGYGFDEAAGNFQETNYTGEGAGNDGVHAEAQDGNFVLNANFGTPPDGEAGRMQMFLWADAFRDLGGDTNREHSTQIRDGDLDAGVIAHEYGHGISNRLVGGPSNVECLRAHDERQGEGWSDFWSYALTMREGDDGATPRGIGNYVTYYDEFAEGEADQFGAGGDIRTGPGIRITPYSTAKIINPSTYDTVKSAAEPHGVGYVWASMLWDMYWNLVDVHGFNANPYDGWETGGNNLTIQLVVDGMKFAGCEPGFEDARDAIIASDAALTGVEVTGVDADGAAVTELRGENFCLIWDTFANRGLGVDADQGDPASKADGSNGFESHPDC